MKTTVDRASIKKIKNAEHGDPFSVLGIHSVPGGVSIRAFAPESAEISAIDIHDRDQRYPMKRIDDDGFFEITIPSREVFAYDLHRVNYKGQHSVTRDPYSFMPTLGEMDIYLFNEGAHYEIHNKLGAHLVQIDGVTGVRFAVWAPNALRVSVVGPFCEWDGRRYPMRMMGSSGVWEIFIPGLEFCELYKYEIKAMSGDVFDKADPFAYASELRPKTASVVWDMNGYDWDDAAWMKNRREGELIDRPLSIYEIHLGSWARNPDDNGWLTYKELAPLLAEYCKQQHYTHIELMPVGEYPYDPSWGYQVTGYFCPTSRFGTPDDFKYFVDFLHNHDIGVIVDWVPAHFPKDDFGLRRFDGTALYEHEDWRMGEHKDWGTLIFNYGRHEVANFLLSSALFWIDYYHIDGIRVDAVASMLYLDYSREDGEWIPNEHGGNENLEAIELLKRMNTLIHEKYPGVLTIAEESTSWPGVSRPVYLGGLGFTMKWNMGWMHDILEYISKEPIHRKHHHNNLTFAMLYAFHENFVLPLSHDEVVYGKRSILEKIPGDEWQKFATIRLLYGYMYAHPGKKMLFQGSDFGQRGEWDFDASTDWGLLKQAPHARLQNYMRRLGKLYLESNCLWENDFTHEGFEWVDIHDTESSIVSFRRKGKDPDDYMLFVFNFTPEPKYNYKVGAPDLCYYEEVINSDSEIYDGSNMGNAGGVMAESVPSGNWSHSISVIVPPLSMLAFKPAGKP